MISRFFLFMLALFCVIGVLAPVINMPAFASELANPKTIRFTTPFPKISPTYKVYQLIYTEAFGRLGLPFSMAYHPDERALINLNAGEFDGGTGRIRELETEKYYPNLIRVDENILHHKSAGLVMHPQVKIDGWESLKNTGKKSRTLEGGADNDTVYSFAWFHYEFISVSYRF